MLFSITLILFLPYGFQTESIIDPTQRKLSLVNNDFAFNIFKLLSTNNKNEVISPISLLSGFSMLYNGAIGQTAQDLIALLTFQQNRVNGQEINLEFKELLSLMNVTKPNEYLLRYANRILAQNDFQILESYRKILNTYFDADIETVNFEKDPEGAVIKVNDWIKNMTNNTIEKLIDDKLDKQTKLVLLNALYFKGNWLQSFPSSLTNENDFFNNGNNEIKVKTMAVTKKFNYTFSEILDSELLEMQYIGNNISFLIILPKNKNGLNNLKSTLNATNLKSATQLMDNRVAEVYLPKFKVEQKFELMSEFKKFSEFETFLSEPDLSLINGENDLKVSQILHKVVIDVDENGTEAAAATGVVITKRTANMIVDPVVFRVDHPFIYLIRDNRNDVILFLGQINDLALK